MSRELNVLLLGMSYVKVNGVDGICRSPDIAINMFSLRCIVSLISNNVQCGEMT